MESVIVTGANGFVGSALVRELLDNGMEVYAAVHGGNRSNLPDAKGLHVVDFDLSDAPGLTGKIPFGACDTFYDFAWDGSAGPKRADVGLQLDNVRWTVDALRVSKELGCDRFLHAGSIMEHETMAAGYRDGNRPGQGYIYGCGKVAAHIMCMAVAAEMGVDLVWPEITNAYGPGERSPRLVNTTIRKCIDGVSPQFTSGTQNYDFVYIDDAARAFRLIGEHGEPFTEYLIGSSTARPLREFLMEMHDSIAPDLEFVFGDVPFTGVDLPLSYFDCSKTELDTGFRAQVSFAEGCRRTRDWIIREG